MSEMYSRLLQQELTQVSFSQHLELIKKHKCKYSTASKSKKQTIFLVETVIKNVFYYCNENRTLILSNNVYKFASMSSVASADIH